MKWRIFHICSLFVTICAWFFAIAISLALILIVAMDYNKPDAVSRIMATGDGVHITCAWGLTYHGRAGHMIAVVQAILVATALWATTSRLSAIRRIGLIGLVIWAGLWTLNAFYVFPEGEFGLIHVTVFFLICTLGTTFARWSVGSTSMQGED
jgi:hypothetical protein